MKLALPAALESRLRASQLMPRKVLVHNPRKRSFTMLTERADGAFQVVKWHDADAPEAVQAGFRNEAIAYRERYFALSPEMLVEDGNFIVLDWIAGGASARALLDEMVHLSRRDVAELVGRVVGSVAAMHADDGNESMGTVAEFVAALRPVHFSLAASGPITTRRPRWESALTRTLARIGRPILEQRVRHAIVGNPALLRRGITHGDLHLDNIVVDDRGRVHVVDLALSRDDGFPAVDVIYALAAAFSMLVHDRRLFRSTASEAFAQLDSVDPRTSQAVLQIAAELALVGGTNRRFNPRGSARGRQITYLWRVVRGEARSVEH